MNKRALIFLLFFAGITLTLLMLDHQEYASNEEIATTEGGWQAELSYTPQSLADQIEHPVAALIIFAAFAFPFILILEATYAPKIRKGWFRLIFLGQAVVQVYLILLIWLVMVFKFWVDINLFLPFYLILIYLGLGACWNLLLCLPYTDKIKFIGNSFDMLSLKNKTMHD